MKYTGLMTVAEVSGYVKKQQLPEVFQLASAHTTQNFHPKIRYAAFMVLAKLGEEKEGYF
jgi:hypothetical protein